MKRSEINTYFTQVRTDLEGKVTKAADLLSSIEQKLNEVETNRQQSASNLSTLNESYDSAMSLITQTRDDLAKVSELRTVAFAPDTGIESLLAKITATSEQAENLATKISSYSEEVASQVSKIGENKATSSKSLSQIEKLNTQAQKLLRDLEKTYQLAINTGLAGSFDERKKRIQKEFVDTWAKRFTISFILLGVMASGILWASFYYDGFTLELLTVFRLGLVSPVVAFTTYSGIQYGKERRLLEKYAFKAAVAASLESYTEILSKNLTGQSKKVIVNFVIDSMKIIYSDPNEEIKKRVWGLSFGNKLGELKSEIVEEVRQEVRKELERDK